MSAWHLSFYGPYATMPLATLDSSWRLALTDTARSIAQLQEMVLALPAPERDRVARIYHIATTVGRLLPPPEMHPWIEQYFGSVAAVAEQRIVKVTNLITLEGALFNELRASRPMEARGNPEVEAEIARSGDPFCHPETGTPADTFGRVRGKHCITASNVAKYDGYHGLVVYDEHNPLAFSADGVADYVNTALAWARKAHNADNAARYFFFMWNALWRAGASIIHGHAQMTLSRGIHYARVEALRRAALLYRVAHGVSYFDDLVAVHRSLGLATDNGRSHVVAHLTPVKEKEVLLIGRRLDRDLTDALYHVLDAFVHQLGVRSFNVALYLRPIDAVQEDWSDFPAIVRVVDRGDLTNRTSDVGAMELYASSVISSDPFRVMDAIGSPERARRQAESQ